MTPLNTTTLYLLRHAEADGPSQSASLSEAGRRAAEALIPTLEAFEIDAIFSSPLDRALQTASPFAAKSGLNITTMPDLREHRLSLQVPDPDDPLLEQRFEKRGLARPGGESFQAVLGRLRQAILAISRRPYAAPLAVTHGGVIASLLSTLDRSYGYAEFIQMPRPALFKVTHRKGSPTQIEPIELTG
ncbi:histidine phosphatase family protein [Shimia ponticola]|uniref:histidine phosphatase family protein n=1 Tax=Shimia ponticola TaxID=2582893 RepID=UPI00164A1E5B|nr:histidine phosphatase family protein [Shimia ponticola]